MRVARAVAGAALLSSCALTVPVAQAPTAPPPPPPVEKLVCPDVDPTQIGEAAKYDRENQQSLAKVQALESTVAELNDRLARLARAEEERKRAAATKKPEPERKGRRGAVAKAERAASAEPPGSTPASDTTVMAVGTRARVRLANELLFRSGQIRITRAGRQALAEVAAVFKSTPSERIQVNGHTDAVKTGRKWADNWQLSLERARMVVAYLIAHGVDPRRLQASGFADTDPVDTGDSDAARARNRRVELFIEPTGAAPSAAP